MGYDRTLLPLEIWNFKLCIFNTIIVTLYSSLYFGSFILYVVLYSG